MKIMNELAKVHTSAGMRSKKNNKLYVEFIATFSNCFRTSDGFRNKPTVFTVRCFGARNWLDEICSKAIKGKSVLLSGTLDQRTITTSEGNIHVTVIVVNNPDMLKFVALEEAS